MNPSGPRSTDLIEHIHPASWDRTRLKLILKAFSGKKILVIGDVGVDRYTIGTVERISPEAPVPIVLVQEERLKLGLAANVADNVHTLGAVPYLTGVVGADRTAEDFKKLLKESGIQSKDLIVDKGRRTVLKERIVSERQQLLRVDYESVHVVDQKIEKQLMQKINRLIRQCDAVLLEDYAKGLLNQRLAMATDIRDQFNASGRAHQGTPLSLLGQGGIVAHVGHTQGVPHIAGPALKNILQFALV